MNILSLSKGRRSSILLKALLGTSVRVASAVVLLSALFLLRHQAAFQRQLELRAESTARSLAAQGQFALLVGNQGELDRIARTALESSQDLLYIVVEDGSGEVAGRAQRVPLTPARIPPGPPGGIGSGIRSVAAGPAAVRCVEATVPVVPQAEGGLFSLPPSQSGALGRVRVGMSLESQRALFLSTLRYVVAIAMLILLSALAAEYFQFRRLLAPLAELAQAARLVGNRDYGGFQAIRHSDDEVGVLVDSFRQMVDQVAGHTRELRDQVTAKERARAELAEAQQRLIDLSRKSGMAEVATSVLHNVGNVLNSVNVSATLVTGRIRESRLDKLHALVEMLLQHAGAIDEYLLSDPKGQRVLPYLEKLVGHLRQEREQIIGELDLLTRNVTHIKQIVSTQQSYARVSGLIEETTLADLMEDAIRIVDSGIQSRDVALLRDFADVPCISSDKHQILQILLNLLRNATRAVRDSGKAEPVIRVRIRRQGEDRIRLEVKDNGVGLARENLTRVFGHGFTTKADGHGFGLHSGALAAKQLGGALWAESDGPGLGATFTLELPLAAPQQHRKESVCT